VFTSPSVPRTLGARTRGFELGLLVRRIGLGEAATWHPSPIVHWAVLPDGVPMSRSAASTRYRDVEAHPKHRIIDQGVRNMEIRGLAPWRLRALLRRHRRGRRWPALAPDSPEP
jgi:hypothetical protein